MVRVSLEKIILKVLHGHEGVGKGLAILISILTASFWLYMSLFIFLEGVRVVEVSQIAEGSQEEVVMNLKSILRRRAERSCVFFIPFRAIICRLFFIWREDA